MRLSEATVAINGLGLMGGSLALALRGKCRGVVGVARRPEVTELAVRLGAIDRAACDLESAAAEADVLVLATPARDIVASVARAGQVMRPGALLTDLGSTKREVVAAMDQLPGGILAVGGHPMCGKESGGLQNADADLFRGATFVLSPSRRTNEEALALATEMVEAIGAQPLVLDAERHDRAVAVISHLPYMVAAALVHAEQDGEREEPAVRALAAGGFRDTTRVAASEVEMMLDILLTNRREVERAIDSFERSLAEARSLLDEPAALAAWMRECQAARRGMFV